MNQERMEIFTFTRTNGSIHKTIKVYVVHEYTFSQGSADINDVKPRIQGPTSVSLMVVSVTRIKVHILISFTQLRPSIKPP